MIVAVFVKLAVNNTEKPAMPFRISRTLRFEVEVACNRQDLRQADDNEVAAILRGFEECGISMRSLNRRGQVVWKATPQLVQELAAAEREVEAEWKNED
jgi:hypothetical protein